ncbi:MAG: N-glycosylase/DNA lyase [Desulfurobacteriaceae bacterium]
MEKLIETLKSFREEEIEKLEEFDRQFLALKKLYFLVKNKETFLKLIVTNALMSYQLQMKGEDYWEKFSEFFSKNPEIQKFEEFIRKYNRRFLNAKLKRLKKVISCVENLFSLYSVEDLGNDLTLLVKELSKCLSQKQDAKTIVFSAKMFMYGYRIAFGKNPKNLEKISIPLDSRLSKISKDKTFWKELSEETKIPPIRLDAIFWIPMGMKKEEIEKLPKRLKEKIEGIRKIISKAVRIAANPNK